jgi:hypothetical protein
MLKKEEDLQREINFEEISPDSEEDIDKRLKINNNAFEEGRKRQINIMFKIILWFIFSIAVLILFTRVFHYLTPNCLHWLCNNQIQDIDRLLVSGMLGGILTKYTSYLFKKIDV